MSLFDYGRGHWEQSGYRVAPNTDARSVDWSRVDSVVIHYTADKTIPDDIPRYIAAMQRSYVNGRGYSLGYNCAIDKQGNSWEIRGTDHIPAATKGENGHTFAVLMLVDWQDPANPAQVDRVRRVIAEIRKHTSVTVTGHRDWGATRCPGDGVYAQLAEFADTGQTQPGARSDGWRTFIDVSKWQGAIDWNTMKASGVDAVYMRAFNGNKKDERLDEYAEGARRVGLPFGLYVFWRPKYSVQEQVDRLLTAHHDLGASLIPMLDIEHADDQPPTVIGQQVTDAVRMVEQRLGVSPVIYTAAWFWNPKVKGANVGHCPVWLARYSVPNPPENPDQWGDYAMRYEQPAVPSGFGGWDAWQFSADGNFRGKTYGASSSHLDLNIMRSSAWDRFQANRPRPEQPSVNIGYSKDYEMKIVSPVRVYDSRHMGVHSKGETRSVRVDNVEAAFVNITVVDPNDNGWVTVWAGTSVTPNVSNVNFSKGQTIANTSWVPVSGGMINIFTSAGCHVLVDLQAVV